MPIKSDEHETFVGIQGIVAGVYENGWNHWVANSIKFTYFIALHAYENHMRNVAFHYTLLHQELGMSRYSDSSERYNNGSKGDHLCASLKPSQAWEKFEFRLKE